MDNKHTHTPIPSVVTAVCAAFTHTHTLVHQLSIAIKESLACSCLKSFAVVTKCMRSMSSLPLSHFLPLAISVSRY